MVSITPTPMNTTDKSTLPPVKQYNLIWVSVVATGLFGLLIAFSGPVLGHGSNFGRSLTIALSIGYSINLFTVVGFIWLRAYLSGILIVFLGLAIGMVSGLGLAGGLLHGSLGFFLIEDSEVLLSSLFFGFIGAIIINGLYGLIITRLELRASRMRELEQEKLIAEAELRALQAQIEPHFLFNTLANTISLIETEPKLAVKSLESLTKLLRSSLQRSRRSQIRIRDELELIRAYLDIQKIRLGDRLEYDIQCEDGLLDLDFAPMLLQPIVENAVLHGIEPSVSGGWLRVVVERLSGSIRLQVINTGSGFGEHGSSGSGCGIENIEKRLGGLYAESATLGIEEGREGAEGFVKVTMTLPVG